MPFKKGNKLGRGRKGIPNKITATLTAAIDQAFNDVGGAAYLVKIAKKNPNAFCALLGRRLPKDVNLGGGLKLEVNLVGVKRPSSD